MTIEDAVNLLTKKHLDNQAKKWIHDPVAYTLYEVWKIADSKEVYSPSYATVQPTTHADAIRAMSDEELASFIERCDCPPHGNYICDYENKSCVQCWLDWLRSPVEGGNHDA